MFVSHRIFVKKDITGSQNLVEIQQTYLHVTLQCRYSDWSHPCNLTRLIGDTVTEDTSVSGICKPGAGLMNVKLTTKSLGKDCYVLIPGMNDIN